MSNGSTAKTISPGNCHVKSIWVRLTSQSKNQLGALTRELERRMKRLSVLYSDFACKKDKKVPVSMSLVEGTEIHTWQAEMSCLKQKRHQQCSLESSNKITSQHTNQIQPGCFQHAMISGKDIDDRSSLPASARSSMSHLSAWKWWTSANISKSSQEGVAVVCTREWFGEAKSIWGHWP